MSVSAQFIVNELVCGLCARPLGGYVELWKGLCSITSTIGMGEGVDRNRVDVKVRVSLLVLLNRMMSTVMKRVRNGADIPWTHE